MVTPGRAFIVYLALSLLLPILVSAAFAGDDSNIFPNRIQVTPPPHTPRFTPVAVPTHTGGSDTSLNPANGSAMGLGIQFHFGGPPPEPLLTPRPSPCPVPSPKASSARGH